jgi:hypothetical protein
VRREPDVHTLQARCLGEPFGRGKKAHMATM